MNMARGASAFSVFPKLAVARRPSESRGYFISLHFRAGRRSVDRRVLLFDWRSLSLGRVFHCAYNQKGGPVKISTIWISSGQLIRSAHFSRIHRRPRNFKYSPRMTGIK